MHDYAIFIGRFQPFHNGHLASVHYGLSIAKKLIIVIGGYQLTPSPVDPWTAIERKKMILKSLTSEQRKRVKYIFIRDRLYDEALWKENISVEIELFTKQSSDIVIIGHEKDHTSYYLKIFPQWRFIETGNFSDINGTSIRHHLFQSQKIESSELPDKVMHMLRNFQKTSHFKVLKDEYERFNMKGKEHFNGMLLHLSDKKRIILRVGSYFLLKKQKQIRSKFVYQLPLADEVNLHKKYGKYFVSERSFYLQKYDGKNKAGRKVQYYHIPNHIAFSLEQYKRSQYEWILLDDLILNESKMFGDSYQIIHSFIFGKD